MVHNFIFVNTLDFDLFDHVDATDGIGLAELQFLLDNPSFFHPKDTLFLRMDEAALTLAGYAAKLHRAMSLGFPVGAHFHLYKPGSLEPETDDTAWRLAVRQAIRRFGPLDSARMGWGFMTNRLMRELSQHYPVDSSAIPRPSFSFDRVKKDWRSTPSLPYRPSRADYRVAGEDSLEILEVPMSTALVSAPYDTMPVKRYLNLAFRSEFLWPALQQWIANNDLLVCITHPSEFLLSHQHALIAYDVEAYKNNILFIEDCVAQCGKKMIRLSLKELASNYELQ